MHVSLHTALRTHISTYFLILMYLIPIDTLVLLCGHMYVYRYMCAYIHTFQLLEARGSGCEWPKPYSHPGVDRKWFCMYEPLYIPYMTHILSTSGSVYAGNTSEARSLQLESKRQDSAALPRKHAGSGPRLHRGSSFGPYYSTPLKKVRAHTTGWISLRHAKPCRYASWSKGLGNSLRLQTQENR